MILADTSNYTKNLNEFIILFTTPKTFVKPLQSVFNKKEQFVQPNMILKSG